MHHIHISLTTIRARLDTVHLIIESLLAQRFEAASFDLSLYLSSEPYLLDEGCPNLTPALEQLQAAHPHRFRVHHVHNTGPYRKILPVLDQVYALPPERFAWALIVTADDDTIYPPHWLDVLYQAYRRHDCVVGYRGRSMVLAENELAPYRQWSTSVLPEPSLLNVLTGKDGILYSPMHLHPDVRHERAALSAAPKADDLWLKAHTLLLGVPTYAIHDNLAKEFPSVRPSGEDVSLYRAYNRRGGNDHAVQAVSGHLVERYGCTLAALTQPDALQGLQAAISI